MKTGKPSLAIPEYPNNTIKGKETIMKEVKQMIGRPDNSVFIRRCILYGILLAVMLFAAPSLFAWIMNPMAARGMKAAWYAVFVPLALIMMGFGLFRAFRRRWPLAYMHEYKKEAREEGFATCPRCGSRFVARQRTRFSRQKVGEKITTTTYSDGSQNVSREGIYESVGYKDTYHVCTNPECAIEAEQTITQSHLPWKNKQIRCLVLNDESLLDRKHPSAASLLLSRLLLPILTLVVIVASAAIIYTYANLHDGEWTYITADQEPTRTAEDYENYLLEMDTQSPNWFMTYEKEPSDMLRWMAQWFPGVDMTTGYSMGSYTVENGTVLTYFFEGNDAGTGIPDGRYTLMQLDGVNVLIDDTNEKIYKEGTVFYDTYAPKLRTLTYDQALSAILERTSGGTHALFNGALPMEYIQKDNSTLYSYMRSDDATQIHSELRAVTLYPTEHTTEMWIFSYDSNPYVPDELKGYVYSDAAPDAEQDALGKLIEKSSDDNGSYTLYRNGAQAVDIDIDYLVNGYEFEFDTVVGEFKGFKEGEVYRVNVNAQTLTKITFDENYLEVATELPLSEYQEQYDFFLSIVPETYIRSIIDMDRAELRKEKLGLIKVYAMKDGSGNVTAEMKVAFGKIGEVLHYTAENEYVMIELAY